MTGSARTCSSRPESRSGEGSCSRDWWPDLGRIADAERSGDGVRLTIASRLAAELGEGDSVAVNGVCLTATAIADGAFAAEVMNETLTRSSLNEVVTGAEVNLELPLRATDRLGGHVVQGHVDGVGEVVEVRRRRLRAPRAGARPGRRAALRGQQRARWRSTGFR